jgi:hypothetical protein
MQLDQRWCTQCGTTLPADARFCEMCGAPAGIVDSEQAEMVIGHLPGEMVGKGIFGRGKAINLVITSLRLLCLYETKKMRENWVAEIVRLVEEEERTGLPWRSYFDSYEWRGPLWIGFYETPPEQLLAAHRDNEAIPLADVLSTTITLMEEGEDRVDILLTSGETRHFVLFDQMGQPADRFLAQALGPERVSIAPSPIG